MMMTDEYIAQLSMGMLLLGPVFARFMFSVVVVACCRKSGLCFFGCVDFGGGLFVGRQMAKARKHSLCGYRRGKYSIITF